MQNFEAIAAAFVRGHGAVQVRNQSELLEAIRTLLADEQKRLLLGKNALAVVHSNQGSLDRTIDMILEKLDSNELFIRNAPRPV